MYIINYILQPVERLQIFKLFGKMYVSNIFYIIQNTRK